MCNCEMHAQHEVGYAFRGSVHERSLLTAVVMAEASGKKRDPPLKAVIQLICKCCRNQVGLADGNWVFQVRGVATSGVSGTTVSASFLVDSSEPIISNLIVSYTAKKQVVNVTVSRSGGTAQVPTAAFRIYTIASDGLLGSGVNPNR